MTKLLNSNEHSLPCRSHCPTIVYYTRIYPTLVIKDTNLEKLYLAGDYQPLTLEDAVTWSKELMLFFEQHHLTILRIGLHPSEGLRDGTALLAGPFHISFKELVMSSVWHDIFHTSFHDKTGDELTIYVNPKHINTAIGHCSENRKWLQERFKRVQFLPDKNLEFYQFLLLSAKIKTVSNPYPESR